MRVGDGWGAVAVRLALEDASAIRGTGGFALDARAVFEAARHSYPRGVDARAAFTDARYLQLRVGGWMGGAVTVKLAFENAFAIRSTWELSSCYTVMAYIVWSV